MREVTVDLFGAEGGIAAGYVLPAPPNAGAPGGLGGETRATLAVTPGQALQITVGGVGSSGTSRHGEYARPGGRGHGSGGGGAHGGGGSGGGNPGNLSGAGGGGGSSFAAPSATDVTLARGVRRGNGAAVVSFRYGASVSVVVDDATPMFGRPVTLTATVTPANPAAGTPSGEVTFFDGTTPLGTAALNDGRASLRTGTLQPTGHTFTARYAGDAAFTPATTGGPTEVTVGFSGPCLTTAHQGPLTVAAGEALCVGAGGSQSGPVTVRPGGALAVTGARITGPVSADGALALTICHSALTGPVTVQRSTGPVVVGSDRVGAACAGNTLRGPLTVEADTGGVEVSANAVTGAVRITGNSGTGPLPEALPPAFRANRVTGPLRCEDNAPDLLQTGTTTTGPRTGQCRPAD
ncbi:Ig-like domain-containing protein [Streptomyces sp. NPDC001594]|uniref:Ig-like domain-containing protein n=1 Tax=Streptomyces sp. NPDC001594 TaxID=3364590 RepID=UPI00367C17BB